MKRTNSLVRKVSLKIPASRWNEIGIKLSHRPSISVALEDRTTRSSVFITAFFKGCRIHEAPADGFRGLTRLTKVEIPMQTTSQGELSPEQLVFQM